MRSQLLKALSIKLKNHKCLSMSIIGVDFMDKQGNLLIGLIWGTSLSVPLWIAFFGWIKVITHFIF
ncbi:hypothetical protein COE25_10275 [Bacillus sp. AFS031507]|nr:hypothetical protein COE25_10275 [Bacillus sp. AFS031507]